MKCSECNSTLRTNLQLTCCACGMYPSDCTCKSKHGYTPHRTVSCSMCGEHNIETVDTTESGWRSTVVTPRQHRK